MKDNFNRFVEQSLELIKKKAFLICFDDIDTDFTKGWPILEILRKYLQPKIITILSGHVELYSAIVRKSSENNIEIDRVKGETDNQLHKFKSLIFTVGKSIFTETFKTRETNLIEFNILKY